ncbi:peptidase inhibitor family I36 protein [Kitasatospora albolonga]|uniref:peptidase inhibitor family I36 protein n=1 Tax=Kitasatospora albolonga TaxID=68173 RepID=UPI0031EF3D9B
MFTKTKLAKFGVSAALAAGLTLALSTSANAASVYDISHGAGSCPDGYVCLWPEANFIHHNFALESKYGSYGSNQNVGDMGKLGRGPAGDKGMQDVASSLVNKTGSSICFYEHNWYGGLQFKVGPHEEWPYLPGWINDKISSFKYC